MKLSKSKIFLLCLVCFIFSIALFSFLPTSFTKNDFLWFTCFIFFSVLAIFLFKFNKNKYFKILALLGLFLFLGFWRYSFSILENNPSDISYYNNKKVIFSGIVMSEPDVREKNVKYEVKVKKIKFENRIFNVSGKVLVTQKLFPKYEYGQSLVLLCELEKPEEFNGFSYDRYLERFDIYSVCYSPFLVKEIDPSLYASASKIESVKIFFYEKIFKFKNKVKNLIEYGLSDPESGLVKAIILGDKQGIDDGLRDKFSKVGLSHIVAISGMHISILSALVMGGLLLVGMARRKAFYAGVCFLILYITLIGMPASAMRAGFMSFLVLFAMHIGRLNKLVNSLILAGAILLFINPRLLRDDIGFQLSFCAVFGIAYVYPLFDGLFKKFENRFKYKINLFWQDFLFKFLKVIFEIFGITMAAQVFTLPIIAINFSVVSLIAPISNLLVLWVLPILMISVLIAILLSLLFPFLGPLWFLLPGLFLKYIVYIAELSVKLPLAYFEVDYLPLAWVFIYYFLVIYFIVKKYNKKNRNVL
jgi:competence protein ComEC